MARSITYYVDQWGNTCVVVGGRELATQLDLKKVSEIVKQYPNTRSFVDSRLKASLAADLNLNLLPEEREQILSELMTQLDEACK